jgi:Pyruvate:ferredoxin oxidoreductase and related 2-oxoacid:ferredoxin oxidoreductases, alpha subunit
MRASLVAGCTFYSAYPMTPATKILEAFAAELPKVEGGVCMLAESELEAVGMVWGALATGARAATGGCGQGLALMQESFAEMTLAQLPLVIFNMARGQGDYFQSTRGGGHGDYRHIVLSPIDIAEAVELTQLAFYLADRWRNPVLIHGDFLLAHGMDTVEIKKIEFPPLPEKDWALDGSTSAGPEPKIVSSIHDHKGDADTQEMDPEGQQMRVFEKHREIAATEKRWEEEFTDDCDYVVTAWGTVAKFVRYAVRQMREQGHRVGYFRPITLWPYPEEAMAAAAEGKQAVLVFESNTGQMYDDVRLAVRQTPVRFIGDFSVDRAMFGVGPLVDVETIKERILGSMRIGVAA